MCIWDAYTCLREYKQSSICYIRLQMLFIWQWGWRIETGKTKGSTKHRLNVHYYQIYKKKKSKRPNETSDVSLNKNIGSCWSKGWFCIWVNFAYSRVCSTGMTGNTWPKKRVEMVSVTLSPAPQYPIITATFRGCFLKSTGVAVPLPAFHLNPAFLSLNVQTCCIKLIVKNSTTMFQNPILLFMLEFLGKDILAF